MSLLMTPTKWESQRGRQPVSRERVHIVLVGVMNDPYGRHVKRVAEGKEGTRLQCH